MLDRTFRRMMITVLSSVLGLSACGAMDKVAPGRDKVDYRKSRAIDTLEVPPELSSDTISDAPVAPDPASTTFSGVNADAGAAAGGAGQVLPELSAVSVQRDGNQQWLVVQGTVEQVWPRVREFWAHEGFLVRLEDPALGIMETDWSENRADIPQGFIRNTLGKALDAIYSAATRDKYRVRLERGAGDSTEIYLTHRGVEEVIKGSTADSSSVWEPRPPDPELEAEMLKRLMVYLGVEEQKAQTQLAERTEAPARAHLVSDAGGSMLVIDEDYSRAWRRTGVALDRVGFVVEDRDRTSGTYFVRYNDPLGEQGGKGVLSKLAFWSSDDEEKATEYRIHLVAEGAVTHVVVNNSKDERETSSTGKRILTLLEEQLR